MINISTQRHASRLIEGHDTKRLCIITVSAAIGCKSVSSYRNWKAASIQIVPSVYAYKYTCFGSRINGRGRKEGNDGKGGKENEGDLSKEVRTVVNLLNKPYHRCCKYSVTPYCIVYYLALQRGFLYTQLVKACIGQDRYEWSLRFQISCNHNPCFSWLFWLSYQNAIIS